jgi:hypothetical protein
MKALSIYLTVCFVLALSNLSPATTPAVAGAVGGVSPGSVAAVGVGAMSSGGVNGVGSVGGYPGAKDEPSRP